MEYKEEKAGYWKEKTVMVLKDAGVGALGTLAFVYVRPVISGIGSVLDNANTYVIQPAKNVNNKIVRGGKSVKNYFNKIFKKQDAQEYVEQAADTKQEPLEKQVQNFYKDKFESGFDLLLGLTMLYAVGKNYFKYRKDTKAQRLLNKQTAELKDRIAQVANDVNEVKGLVGGLYPNQKINQGGENHSE